MSNEITNTYNLCLAWSEGWKAAVDFLPKWMAWADNGRVESEKPRMSENPYFALWVDETIRFHQEEM